MEASLYIHVPFCGGASGRKCDYCDFYSIPVREDDPRLSAFVDTILAEGARLFGALKPRLVPTVYIGGGTPSVLGAPGIRRLLRGVFGFIAENAPPPQEITVEANPESADEAFLAAAREGGATRLSLGVQTFHGPSRRAVHRIGAEESSGAGDLPAARLRLASEYFPGAFSADLMSGLPFQNENILLDDIEALLSFKPAHVSLYALTLAPGTPLAEAERAAAREDRGRAESPRRRKSLLPDADEADRLWICGRDALEKAGRAQYEVSNFCLPGKESQHNIRYWRMRDWLALGPGASGTLIEGAAALDAAVHGTNKPRESTREGAVNGFRYTVPPDVNAWLGSGGTFFTGTQVLAARGSLPPATEELDSLTLIKESFLMGFRYVEGPDEALFRERFRQTIEDCIPDTLAEWRERGLARKDKTALTARGLLFLDRFLRAVFQEL